MGVRVFDGQVDDLTEQFLPELFYDAKAQPGAEYALGQPQEAHQQIGSQHEKDGGLQVAASLAGDNVHSVALEHGGVNTEKGTSQNRCQHADDQFLFLCKIRTDALHGPGKIFGVFCFRKTVAMPSARSDGRRLGGSGFCIVTHGQSPPFRLQIPYLPPGTGKYPDRFCRSEAAPCGFLPHRYRRFPG